MKENKRKNFFLPEEKKYLLWVFLTLLTILLLQILIYPKIQKRETYVTLRKTYQKDIKIMNNKIADAMLQQSEFKKQQALVNSKLSYRGNVISLLHNKVNSKMPNTFKVKSLSSGKHINSRGVEIIPVYLEFTSNKNDLNLFLIRLNALSVPVEILDLKVQGLSPTDISVKIQMILEKR